MTARSSLAIRRPVAWVTGASRGIGREIAKQFASIGCEVCLSARSKERLSSAVKEIVKLGGRAHSFPCDVSSVRVVSNTARCIQREVGRIDLLVNNAGITVFKSVLSTSLSDFEKVLATDLFGQIACVKAVLPGMIKRRQGWIINILSNAAVKTFEGSSAYTAAKSGMLGFAKVLREEMRRYGVKVINVIPGPVETHMWSASDRKKYSGRMMTARSVAEAVLSVYQMPGDAVVDELIIRPILGDID